MATLIMELALTRIFSVVFFYHFAFLAISVTNMGIAETYPRIVVAATGKR